MSNNETVYAAVVLSPLENVATMARMAVGRNAISGLFNLSPNSVKKLPQRIEEKLGPDWQKNPCIIWPDTELAATSEAQEEEDESLVDTWEGGYCQRLEKELLEQEKSHRAGRFHFIHKDAGGREILHVTGAQRFWLKPVLTELEERKLIKLLAVDWNETFAPAWLPVVYRGRKEIRAADYATGHARHVTSCINNYLQHRLHDYILGPNTRLEEVRGATRHKYQPAVPDLKQLVAMALADFQPR